MGNALLAAGKLDRRVTIVTTGAGSRDENGEVQPGAEVLTERWAAVRPAPGLERFASAENAAAAPMRFILRWEDGLVPVTASIRHDGRDYAVSSVTEIGRREGLEVLAVARGE